MGEECYKQELDHEVLEELGSNNNEFEIVRKSENLISYMITIIW